MAKEHSFDIVSKVDMQILKDVVNVATKTIKGRYDLKGGANSIELNEKENTLTFTAESEMSLTALKDIFSQSGIKRDISTKAFEFSPIEKAFSGNIRVTAKVKQGIDKESAKKINALIKDGDFKAKTQIQDEQIRVTSKDIDTLQNIITMLRSQKDLDIALQFLNFR